MSVQALKSLYLSSGDFELEVFVIDNASKDNSAEVIKQSFPNITLIENDTNVGFGRANNQVLSLLNGDFVLLLNTDAFVQPDTIQKSIAYMQSDVSTGILGVKLLGRDGDLQPSCRYWPTPLNIFAIRTGLNRLFKTIKMTDDLDWNPKLTQNCDWVPGCYYLMRRQLINTVGLFNPIYFLYYEEVDHCLAAKKAGWNVTYFAETAVVHIGGESAKSDGKITTSGKQLSALQVESELIFFRKNYGLFTCLLNIALAVFADIFEFFKALIQFKFYGKTHFFTTSLLMFTCAFKTQIGRKPTR
jgi:N-acetylglucosaminyl-diphospho-decaprenol L-rhamnosyltransferase